MHINDMSNAELLRHFALQCFKVTNYPNNKSEHIRFVRLLSKLGQRLGLTLEEIEDILHNM